MFRKTLILSCLFGVVGALLTRSAGPSLAAYPGDNGRIAYVSERPGGPGTQREIFTIQKDGTGRRRLTNNDVKDDDPVYSPTGRRIAFERAVGGLDDELFTMSAEGGKVRRLTQNDCQDGNPTWSPNGNWLAFDSTCPDSVGRDIWKIRLSDLDRVQLTDAAESQIHPAWSVDQEIAFEDQAGGDVDIWKMDPNGTDQVPLTSGADDDQDPSWSPNGNFIAFERIPDGTFDFDLWRMRANGSDEEELNAGATEDGQPAYAPNNRRIAFARSPDGMVVTDIFLMAADGGPGKRLTNENLTAGKPDWQPLP
jgi:Tol biopolymer transport system component